MSINELSEAVIGACIEVHRTLGPGLLESVYEQCLCRELSLRKIPFVCQAQLPVNYKGMMLDCGYKIDVFVDNRLVVELKSIEKVLPVHEAQLLTYLRLSGCEVGLIINFNVVTLKEGIMRRVRNFKE
jgi:GxxExxY protein